MLYLSTDVDECVDDSLCDVNAVCHNTEGSYTCQCGEGYFGSGTQCEGIVSVHKTKHLKVYSIIVYIMRVHM